MKIKRKSKEISNKKNVGSNDFLRYSMLVTLILIGEFLVAQQSGPPLNIPPGAFRAAVVKVDITPKDTQNLLGYDPRRSTGVLDHIFHKIVALDDGITQFFLVSSDICLISPALYDSIAAILYTRYKIKPINFWWTVTHTHSAPEVGPPGLGAVFMGERYQHTIDSNYTALLIQKLIEGILESRKKLTPARLGVGWGFSQANINRRAIDIDGKSTIGRDPDGAVDRRIGLLRIDKEDGKPLALIANYPIHGTVMHGGNLLISGDAPGIVSEYVEQKIGAPVLFINGAAGDLAPIESGQNPEDGHLGQYRVLLGDKIIVANKKILSTTDEIRLSSREIIFETPRKTGLGWSNALKKYGSTKKGINMVRVPLRFLKINEDIAIWSSPVELFCEISNIIRDRSPFPYTFYFGYNNGWLGYLPTAVAWEQGGYEPEVSPFTPGAANDITESVIGYLQGEMRNTAVSP